LPERLIGSNPGYYLASKLRAWSKGNDLVFKKEAVAEYVRCFNADCVHATCEDYRAAATIDLEHDAMERETKMAMPILALWGERGLVGNLYNVLEVWQSYAENVEGLALPCGHFLPEEAPRATFDALADFLTKNSA
jgi:haloacetate dehalogenase